jgi:anti-sigma factor RsiW
MSDILCSYKDREAVLMAYLYDEITPADREAFDVHLTTCARCRVELNGLGGVRAQLLQWAPPDYRDRPAVASEEIGRPRGQLATIGESRAPIAERRVPSDERRSWRDIPAWAQAAAAMLILGVSAGAANLNIHYDGQSGLNVRTGWSHPAQPVAQAPAAPASDTATRTELAALEQQLRHEIQAASTTAPETRAVSASNVDARRVKMLLDESERRHEREMALKIAEVIRDFNAQRQSDLVKIDQNLGLIDRRNDIEVRKNRQMIDMYLQRVSQRQ